MKVLFTSILCLLAIFSFGQAGSSSEWVWLTGSSVQYEPPVYGNKGVPDSRNTPGRRSGAAQFKDLNGNLWIYGGIKRYPIGDLSYGNDVWMFNVSDNKWTWVAGDSVYNALPHYGPIGVGGDEFTPGGRYMATAWTDPGGGFWLFGGYSNLGYFNDMWKFDISTRQWKFYHGTLYASLDGSGSIAGQYSPMGVGGNNNPGGRYGASGIAISVSDNFGTHNKMYLFGGFGFAGFSTTGVLGELWVYDDYSNEWIWESGNTQNIPGVYNFIPGQFDANSKPGSRSLSVAYYALPYSNYLWFFGGNGKGEAASDMGYLNDLWAYDMQTKQWAWFKGDKVVNQNGVFGTRGLPAATNTPRGLMGASGCVDIDGKLVLFGGQSNVGFPGYSNALWKYDIGSNNWTWLKGDEASDVAFDITCFKVNNSRNKPGGSTQNNMWSSSNHIYLYGGSEEKNILFKLTNDNEPCIYPINQNYIQSPSISSFCITGSPGFIPASIPGGGNCADYNYQWQQSADNVNFTNIAGAIAANYNPGTLTATTYYKRIVTSAACSSSSNTIVINVGLQPLTPSVYIGTTSASTTICAGTSINFGIAFSQNAGSNPSYQWQKNGVNIPGATGSTYSSSTLVDKDSITCVMTSDLACASPQTVVSNYTVVTVKPLPVAVMSLSGSCIGNTTLNIAGADSSFSMQWLKDGTTVNISSIATVAASNNAAGIYADVSGNVYVADRANHRVQKWAPGALTGLTVAGGNGAGAAANQLNSPNGIYVDVSGNIYVADEQNQRIQKWAPGASVGVTVAGGNGNGPAANQLAYPWGVYVDIAGYIYVSDNSNHRVQRWAPGAVSGVTVAGGNGLGAGVNQLAYPGGLWLDGSGNIYIADANNHRVQKWIQGAISGVTVAGGNGYGSAANQLAYPKGICLDASGNVYVSDDISRVQKWGPGSTTGITVAGGIYGGDVRANTLFINTSGNRLYTSNGVNVYRWNIPVVFPPVNFIPAATGNYQVVVTARNGCIASSNVIAVVNNLPDPSLTLADQNKNPHIVRDIARCPTVGSLPSQLKRTGNKIIFTADSTGGNSPSLWISDGTNTGTLAITMVSQLNSSKVATSPFSLTSTANGKIFFRSKTAANIAGDIWVTDSSGNTILLDEFTPSHNPLGTQQFDFLQVIGNQIFYNAETNDGHWQLKKSDGTVAGTAVVKDFGLSDGSGGIYLGIVLNNKLYFDFYNTPGGFQDEIWTSDGTEAGTQLVYNLGSSGGLASYLMPTSNNIYFYNYSPAGIELWKTNGAAAGTSRILLVDPNFNNSNNYPEFYGTPIQLVFVLNNGANGPECWVTNGDSVGTFMLKDINPTATTYADPSNFTLFNNTLYFTANDGVHGTEMWRAPYPFRKDSVFLFADFNPGSADGVAGITTINNRIYFAGNDGVNGTELWTTDSTFHSAVLVSDINPGSTGSSPAFFKNVNTFPAYITASSSTGRELYQFNAIDKIWKGTGNNLWSNPNNWTPGGIPQVADNVLVPKLSVNDSILVDIEAFCHNLWVNPGAGVEVLTGKTLLVHGSN